MDTDSLITRFLMDNYKPCSKLGDEDLYLNTKALLKKLMDICPDENFTANRLIQILQDLDYMQVDLTGEMDHVWLFKTLS